MGREVTRTALRRALVVNALTKPVNVIVPTLVVVGAVAVGATWLFAVAAIVYVVLAAMTFFDEAEAERVGDRVYGRDRPAVAERRVDPGALAAPIAAQFSAALEEETRIRRAIEQTDGPFTELSTEVSSLVGAMGRTAARAQLVYDYLASQDPRRVEQRMRELRTAGSGDENARPTLAALSDQLAAQRAMQGQLDRFHAEMEQTVASLSTIHAQVVRMRLASDAGDQRELAGEVRDLRAQVDALSEGMNEAYARGEDAPTP